MSSPIGLESLWPDPPDAWRQKCQQMWRDHGLAVPQPEVRAGELVQVATQGDALAGVSTAQLRYLPLFDERFYYLRIFVAPPYRNRTTLLRLLRGAIPALQTTSDEDQALGVLLELEHPDFFRAGRRAIWHNPAFVYIGKSPRGFERRLCYFDGACLSPRSPPASS